MSYPNPSARFSSQDWFNCYGVNLSRIVAFSLHFLLGEGATQLKHWTGYCNPLKPLEYDVYCASAIY